MAIELVVPDPDLLVATKHLKSGDRRTVKNPLRKLWIALEDKSPLTVTKRLRICFFTKE